MTARRPQAWQCRASHLQQNFHGPGAFRRDGNFAGTICHKRPNILEPCVWRLAENHKRHGIGELEHRAAVQRRKILAIQFKRHGEDRAVWVGLPVGKPQFVQTPRVLEDARINGDSLFGIRVELEERRDTWRALEITLGSIITSADEAFRNLVSKKPGRLRPAPPKAVNCGLAWRRK